MPATRRARISIALISIDECLQTRFRRPSWLDVEVSSQHAFTELVGLRGPKRLAMARKVDIGLCPTVNARMPRC